MSNNDALNNNGGVDDALGIGGFQFMDPQTGAWAWMVAEGDGFRPATAQEELASGGVLPGPANAGWRTTLLDAAHRELDAFVAQYSKSYPEADELDDGFNDMASAPSM